MSKAFTRESDYSPEPAAWPRPSPLPPGTRNYITSEGARRLQIELDRLVQIERPKLMAIKDDSESRPRLQSLEQQIQQLRQTLGNVQVVLPPRPPWERVRFGAAVTVRNRKAEEKCYCIVGVDETDVDRGRVSWLSPIARALLNARLHERVHFKFPSGEEELEVLRIRYD